MTVAAFREAQVRSRTSSHIPDHASDGMPPGNVPLRPASPADSGFSTPPRPTRQLPPSSFGINSPTPSTGRGRTQSPAATPRSQNQSPAGTRTPAPRTQSRLSNHRWAQNTSSEDETSSEDSDERDATITKTKVGGGKGWGMKAKSELGHGHSRQPSREQQWPSASKSELGHGGELFCDLVWQNVLTCL
jgi:hypothetical protein